MYAPRSPSSTLQWWRPACAPDIYHCLKESGSNLGSLHRNRSCDTRMASGWTSAATRLATLASFPSAVNVSCSGNLSNILLYSGRNSNHPRGWRGDFACICSTSGDWASSIWTEVYTTWYAALIKGRWTAGIRHWSGAGNLHHPTGGSSGPIPLCLGLPPSLHDTCYARLCRTAEHQHGVGNA